uniref:protein piccolo isoform X4 n=2 Tax=Oncorhynchus gorbuscha TaxID=8017 RepID=UPI001EAE993C|nr:protein piccolo isoform X4 [Oncorhynchus gorbuscha]
MGNEASLEGGEGVLAGLPEGLAPDGKGGFIRTSTGAQVDLSQLSEDDRKQLAAAMSRAQANKPGGAPARRPSEADVQQRPQQPRVGPSVRLSKSRTVDAFGEGPTGRPAPGRSPSSLSLLESRFRQEPKDPEKKTGMFGSSFLSGANPLNAVSSMTSQVSSGMSSMSSEVTSMGSGVNMPSFGLFDKEEKPGEKPQGGPPGPGSKGPQQGGPRPPGPGQGPRPPGQQGPRPTGQGPLGQQGPRTPGPGQGPRPPGQQGPRPTGQGPPGQQGPRTPGPGQGPRPPGQQGPRPTGQGPPGQQGPRPPVSGQGPPGQQGPRPPGQVPPGQQGPRPPGPGQGPPGQQGAPGPGAQPGGPAKAGGLPGPQGPGKPPGGGLCPLCKTTQLNVGSKEPPNFSNCTMCKNQVCSLCGFSPPDSEGKEWLCLNCQMQRAMGGMDDPPMMGKGSAPPSPSRKDPGKDGKKPNLLIKQQSISDRGLTPPTTPKQKSPGPSSPKGSPQPSPAKGKQESSFFGGLGGISLGGLTDVAKPPAAASQAAESITGTMFSGFGGFTGSAKPDRAKAAAGTQKTAESVTGKMFSGFGGFTETAKPPAAASQMFGFGSSILSSATNLMTTDSVDSVDSVDDKAGSPADSPAGSPAGSPPESPFSAPGSPLGSPPDSPFSAPGSPPDSDSPDTPPASKKAPKRAVSLLKDQKSIEADPSVEPLKAGEPLTTATGSGAQENCPLCKVELNVGSADPPNYSNCTECKKSVCNLCGFNPTPHLGEKEWLCLNCQTQRALSGQLGDMPPPPSPVKKQLPTPTPTPPASPAKVPDSPAAAASPLTGSPSVTQVEAAAAKEDTQPLPISKVVAERTPPQTPDAASANTDTTPIPPEHATPPSDSVPEEKESEQADTVEAISETILDEPVTESVVESAVEASVVEKEPEQAEAIEAISESIRAEPVPESVVESIVEASVVEKDPEQAEAMEAISETMLDEPVPESVAESAVEASVVEKEPEQAEAIEAISECIRAEPVPESVVESTIEASVVEKDPEQAEAMEAISETMLDEPVPESVAESAVEAPEVDHPESMPEKVTEEQSPPNTTQAESDFQPAVVEEPVIAPPVENESEKPVEAAPEPTPSPDKVQSESTPEEISPAPSAGREKEELILEKVLEEEAKPVEPEVIPTPETVTQETTVQPDQSPEPVPPAPAVTEEEGKAVMIEEKPSQPPKAEEKAPTPPAVTEQEEKPKEPEPQATTVEQPPTEVFSVHTGPIAESSDVAAKMPEVAPAPPVKVVENSASAPEAPNEPVEDCASPKPAELEPVPSQKEEVPPAVEETPPVVAENEQPKVVETVPQTEAVESVAPSPPLVTAKVEKKPVEKEEEPIPPAHIEDKPVEKEEESIQPAQVEDKPVEEAEPIPPAQVEEKPIEEAEPIQPAHVEDKPIEKEEESIQPAQVEEKPVEKEEESFQPAQVEEKPIEEAEPIQPAHVEDKPIEKEEESIQPAQVEEKPVEKEEESFQTAQVEEKPIEEAGPIPPAQVEEKTVEEAEPIPPAQVEEKPVEEAEPIPPVQVEEKPVEEAEAIQPAQVEEKPVEKEAEPIPPAQVEEKPVESEAVVKKVPEASPAPPAAEPENVSPERDYERTESETVVEPSPEVKAEESVSPSPFEKKVTEQLPEPEPQSAKVDQIPPQGAVEAPAPVVEKNTNETETEAGAERVGQKDENLTSVDTKVEPEPTADNKAEKTQDESTAPASEAKEEEKVKAEHLEQATEAASLSSAASEPQAPENVSEEKPTQEGKVAESIAENKQEVSIAESRVPAPTVCHEKEVQEKELSKDESKQTPKTDSVSESIQPEEEKVVVSPPVVSEKQEHFSVSEVKAVSDRQGSVEEKTIPEQTKISETVSENESIAPAPVVEPDTLVPVVGEQDEDKPLNEEKIIEAELDAVGEATLKDPGEKNTIAKDSSPTSPSDLAKLESTVLPILEAQATQPKDNSDKLTDSLKTRRKLEVLALSPESPSTEDDPELSEKKDASAKKKLLVPTDIRGDSLEDSSESLGKDSPVSGDDEDFIRKQIMEMSENEDASPSDEENLIRRKIRDHERKRMEQEKGEGKERSAMAKGRRLLKKNTISPEDEDEQKISLDKLDKAWKEGSEPKVSDSQEGEQPSADRVVTVRQFRTIELNTTTTPVRIPGTSDDGELEMESLTNSPDDRSRGDGSSSLHASSFTPGTSPTSLSSLDEDSDSSSPSRMHSGEGKQHRKAKHRQQGQGLPTIEDSSEEEELREEEELLREQEKQKGSGKKSKKDKEEIRAQRRRERPKTPPSNLSPIEDASPTEELRQEAEMEEFRRSSLSDFSPSIESEPEGVEINAAKIAAVQKVYQLPTSVSLYSPTADQGANKSPEKRALKTADEAYEDIMLKAKTPTKEKVDTPPGKESLYGGMLIEDYAYESLVDGNGKKVQQREPEKISVPAQPKILRSPDEVYEDMMEKKKEFMQLEQELKKAQSVSDRPTPEIVLQPTEPTRSTSVTVTIGKDGKPLLDAEATYEELMKKVLTPGTSPTQQGPDISGAAPGGEFEGTESRRALRPIPDLRVTQCSSGEEDADEEATETKSQDMPKTSSDIPKADQAPLTAAAESKSVASKVTPSKTSDQPQTQFETSQADQPLDITQQDVMDLSSMKSSAPAVASVSPLPTVPQYTPTVPSVVSTTPPVPPKPAILHRALSQEKVDIPEPPPLPPPTMPKPSVYPRKPPVPLPSQAIIRSEHVAMTTAQGSPVRQPHIPPPVPPKPAIPAGMGYSHRPGENVKPPLAPKPGSQPGSPAHIQYPRPTALHTGHADIALNLSPSAESRPGHFSGHSSGHSSGHPSPTSPRYGNRHETYVVITLPSQPNSPVEGITTQAPSSPGPASPSRHAQPPPQSQTQYQPQPQPQKQPQPPPPHTNRMPLAFTRITESMESQEICGPEKVVSSSCHVIEAISASAPPPEVRLGQVTQFVTTEVQRTMVSVRHERSPPPPPAPRANGVPISLKKPKPQQTQSPQGYQPGEVVDLRTMKVNSESAMKVVDLSSSDVRRQSLATDISGRQTSAVQSPVVNLSTESTSVSIVTDSITIVTCAATIQSYENTNISQVPSLPLQLTTTNKAFEPVCQIIYRPIDAQPTTSNNAEIPINLSLGPGTGLGSFQPPVTIAPTPALGCVANGLSSGMPTVAGAVDLSTAKPFNTVVSVDASSAEVVTAVITEEDGKPVDLTAGRRAVCCDVVYKLPFTGSCTTQQPTTPLPEDRFGYRDDHYQYDRSPYNMRGFGGIKPSMSDTNLAEAGLFLYKSKNSYNFHGTTEGAVDLTSSKTSDAGVALDFSTKGSGLYSGMIIPPYSQARVKGAVGTHFGTSSVLRSSNGVVYSSVSVPIPSTYAITTQPGSIFSTTYNSLSAGMHTSDTMPSLSTLQNQPMTRSHSFISTTSADNQGDVALNLELAKDGISTSVALSTKTVTLALERLDSYTDSSLEAIAASLEALSSPCVPGEGQYQMQREILEMEKFKQQRLAEELEWERQEIQRFREQEQMLVQKELEELQSMKQAILCQQEDERQAHLMMQKETYAQQQQQLEQIQRLQEQLRAQLEEQKFRKMYPGEVLLGHGQQEAVVLGPDGTELARKIMDSGCQTDDEDSVVDKAYTAGRKKRSTAKKSVDSCVQTDDEDQEEWEPARARRSRPRTSRGDRGGQTSDISIQAHSEISIQTDSAGNVRMDTRMELSDSESPHWEDKRRPTPLEIEQFGHLRADPSSLQAPPKSPNVLYSPISPCISPSKSLEFVSYEKSLGDTSPQRIRGSTDPTKVSPTGSPKGPKAMQRSMSDPKPMSPTGEERASSSFQYGDGSSGKSSSGSTPTGTGKKVKRTLPNPPSEEEATAAGQTAYSTGSARRRMCRNTNMARAKILQDIDRELDMVERESSKLRHKQAELDEEEKEIDAKLRYLEMGINRRKDALLKEREKRERAYLQSVAEDRDYMSDSEVSNIRETRSGRGSGEDDEMGSHGLERPRTAPQSELDDFVPPQTTHEAQYGTYSQYQYPLSQTLYQQQSLYQSPQSYQSQSIYSSVPSLSSSQQQSYHQMLLLQQKAARQAALIQELDASSKYEIISRQPDPVSSAYMGGVRYDKYGNHLDLRALEVGGSMAGSPMSNVSADSFYGDVEHHHHTPRSYVLLEDAAELAKSSTSLASSSYAQAEKELAKAERLLRRSAADLTSTDYLGSSSRLHSGYGKTPDDEDSMDDPYELKLLKQQLKQEFRRSTGGTESLDPLTGLSHNYYGTPSLGVSSSQSYSQRHYPKTEKYSISRLTLEKQAAKQLPASMLYQKQKAPLTDPKVSKYSSMQDGRSVETDYTSYLGSSNVSASPRSSRLLQDEITFGLRKNIAEQQKYLGSTLGANLAGSLNFGQSLALDSTSYPSGSRSRPSSRPNSVYGLDLSLKRDPSSSSLRLKGDGEAASDSYQMPSGRAKPTSLPIVQGGRGRIPILAQNSEEESPLSPVGQPMGMARASAGPLPPISADSRDQFGSCLSLQDSQQQQHLREEPTRGRGYVLMDDLQGTMSDGEALSDSMLALNRDDHRQSHENIPNAYHLRLEETDWFDKPHEGRLENGQGPDRRQGKGVYYPFPHTRVKLQRDPKDRSVSGNGLGIRVVGGKEVPGTNGHIGAYVAKVLPGGVAQQTGKILEGMQVLEWNELPLTGKTYEEVQVLVVQQCGEAELCVRLDLNMLADSEGSQHLDLPDQSKPGDRPPRSPGVDPKQLAAELQKVSLQQAPPPTTATSSSSTVGGEKGPHSAISGAASATSSAIQSPGQPGSPSVSKKRHSSKSAEPVKTQSHPVTGEIQLQINYDKQLGNLIVHVLQARNLSPRDNNGYSDPFVKVYLLPGRGQVMVVQNASAENKRRSKQAGQSLNPEWNQTVIYKNIHLEQLRKKLLEVSVWDYDKCSSNDFLGEVLMDLSNTANMDNVPRWLPLKEQSEGEHHRRSLSAQGRQHSPKPPSQHTSPKTPAHGNQDSPKPPSQHASPKTPAHGNQDPPKSSVIKSRSHGIFPDPAKDTQVPTIEKSHSSPGTSKPSPSEGHSQHTPRAAPRAAPRKSARQHQQDGAGGVAVATGEAPAPQQQHRLQPTRPGRSGDAPVTAASLDSGLSGSAHSLLEDEGGTNAVDSAIFQVPRFGKIPNGTDVMMSPMGHMDSEGKTQVMGEIKIALRKELKTEGDQLVLEILQCRNITYKFKSPDHLPDLYVKLYVVNIATQKRIIKKKTRVCRHDREPSFNETFRFCMNPTGHSLQLFLVSNGGKFIKKTLIGEAYIWLDKVDVRKRVVSWHKLLASSAQIHS